MRTDIAIEEIKTSISAGGKILVIGNGGSAAMAEHFAGELVCNGMPCIALTSAAVITAIGNDIGFESVFSMQVGSLGCPGDILIALTTSGKSKNIKRAVETAHMRGLTVIHLPTGEHTMPSMDTQAVQEQHLCLLHEIWQGLLR